MSLLQTIINYYNGEARHGFWGAAIGGLLLVGALVLWKLTLPFSLLRGFSVPMLLFGLLIGIGGGADGMNTRKMASGKIALYQKDASAFLKQESIKVEKIHKGWRGIRIFWSLLGFGGLVLSVLIRKPFWIGAGSGSLALAIIISLFELYSMRFNEHYYRAIRSAATQEMITNLPETPISAQQRLKLTRTEKQPLVDEQKYADPAIGNSVPQPLPFDSSQNLSARHISIVIEDTSTFNIPESLEQPLVTNETARIDLKIRKRKILDHYNSDLIRANSVNARRCWFSKRYIQE